MTDHPANPAAQAIAHGAPADHLEPAGIPTPRDEHAAALTGELFALLEDFRNHARRQYRSPHQVGTIRRLEQLAEARAYEKCADHVQQVVGRFVHLEQLLINKHGGNDGHRNRTADQPPQPQPADPPANGCPAADGSRAEE